MKVSMKKISSFLFALLILCGVIAPTETVFAASGKLSVSASSTSVNIGDTVKITAKAAGPSDEQAVATMTLTFDSDILQFQSCSSSVYGGGGNTVTVTGDSFTVTLKAVASGKSKISLSGTDGVIFSSTEELDSMSSDSTSVTVNNSASDNGNSNNSNNNNSNSNNSDSNNSNSNNSNNNNSSNSNNSSDNSTSTDTAKSADNSLQTLTLSAGTLSPAFQYNVVSYTATVPNSVTNLSVTAVASNKAATVESVTGNTDLVVGKNEIKIVVKAENGVTATYTVTVTREAASADSTTTDSETKDETPSSEADTENTTGESISVDNVSYNIVENFAAEAIPADFTETTVTYHEKSYKGLVYNHGTQVMLYLAKADAAESSDGKFFIYDETRDCFYPFVRLTAGSSYVIALYAPVNEEIPDSYVQTTALVGEETISAYQTGAEDGSDFYLFYGINQEGTEGWYQYDKTEGTYQRLNTTFSNTTSDATETVDDTEEDEGMAYLRREYSTLSETYAKEKAFSRNVMAILIFVIAVLAVGMINLLLQRRKDDEGPKPPKPKTPKTKEVKPKEVKPKEAKPKKVKGNLFLQRPDDILDGDLDEPFEEETFEDEEDDFDTFVENPKQQSKKETKKENIDVIDFNDL